MTCHDAGRASPSTGPPNVGSPAQKRRPRGGRLEGYAGGWGGSRTPDTGIFSPLLYQLSYPAGHRRVVTIADRAHASNENAEKKALPHGGMLKPTPHQPTVGVRGMKMGIALARMRIRPRVTRAVAPGGKDRCRGRQAAGAVSRPCAPRGSTAPRSRAAGRRPGRGTTRRWRPCARRTRGSWLRRA